MKNYKIICHIKDKVFTEQVMAHSLKDAEYGFLLEHNLDVVKVKTKDFDVKLIIQGNKVHSYNYKFKEGLILC